MSKTLLRRIFPQPLFGIIAIALGALALSLASSQAAVDPRAAVLPSHLTLAGGLVTAVLIAERFPLHLRYHIKLYITTIPLFLIAVLLPPALATVCAGTAILISEWLARASKGNRYSDVVTAAGRWMVIGFVTSAVAGTPLNLPFGFPLALLLGAVVMFLLDMLSVSFEISAMSGESPVFVLNETLRASALAEIVQYSVGLVAALAAMISPLSLLFGAIPCVMIYFAFKHAKEMRASTQLLLEGMADAVDLRDHYTGGHSRRVAEYCRQILRGMNLRGAEADLILTAARVHDIGKLGIPDCILNKPTLLTPEETLLMQSHCQAGADLLAKYPDFGRGRSMVLHHHERWDGAGYPHKLKGMEIPLGARIIAVADGFDAMTSDRPYRRAMTPKQAANILLQERGRQWDPRIVDVFLSSVADLLQEENRVPIADIPRESLPVLVGFIPVHD